MTQRTEHRYEVTFTASEAPDGRPVIALILNQEGQAAAGQNNSFFLDVDQTIAPDALPRIAALLTQYVKGFGVMIRKHEETQNQSEPDDGIGTNVLRPEVLAENAIRRDEPGSNREEEGQPIPPLQIDSVKEAGADEPQRETQNVNSIGPQD